MYILHPSGFCCHYSPSSFGNLSPGVACPICKRIVGHKTDCKYFKPLEDKGKTSRPKLYNASSVLWAKSKAINFLTFTLPSISGGTYQRDAECPYTGDLEVTRKLSKVLESWALREKRAGRKLSYTWVSERQEERKKKYGGAADIHYHLLANCRIKSDDNKLINPELLNSLQASWCDHLGVGMANNCIDVRPVPKWVNSVPAYLAKYLGKGKQRMIFSRRFSATRDLTEFRPIHLTSLPDCRLETQTVFTTEKGHDVVAYYFNTSEVLETYALVMHDEGMLHGSRPNESKVRELVTSRQEARTRRQLNDLYPHMGLSYPT